jgi:Domain of unknown function DUF11
LRGRFALSRVLASVVAVAALTIVAGCHNSDVTGANGALARLTVDAPDNATTGQNFDIHVTAQNIGVENIQKGVVKVTLPSPLTVVTLNAESGTTASFSSSTITWNLGVLDSNTQSELTITTMGVTPTQTNLTVNAQMTATGINAGDAVASDTVTLNP